MKTKNNIEAQFKKLKQAYKVPDNYFDNFTPVKPKPNKRINIRLHKRTWAIAAGMLLIVSLGYKILHWQHAEKGIPNIPQNQINRSQQDLFKDISDDEIIDYLTDENISEQMFDY